MKKKSSLKKVASAVKEIPVMESATKKETMNMGKDNCSCASCYSDCAEWGLALLRVVVGIVFAYHGIWKFQNWAMASGMFSGLFGGAGTFLLGLVAVVEIVAGLALIIGIWTKWAGYLLAVIMAVALIWAKKFGWPSIELDLVLFAATLALAWSGPGKWSLHSKCGCCDGKC